MFKMFDRLLLAIHKYCVQIIFGLKLIKFIHNFFFQLAIKDAEVSEVISKCRPMVAHFSRSPKAYDQVWAIPRKRGTLPPLCSQIFLENYTSPMS